MGKNLANTYNYIYIYIYVVSLDCGDDQSMNNICFMLEVNNVFLCDHSQIRIHQACANYLVQWLTHNLHSRERKIIKAV